MATVECVLGPDDAPDLRSLYETYGWWADRGEEEIRRAVAGTDETIGLQDDDELVASARVLTDYAYYGMIFDVIVRADRRGEGFGRDLMAAVVAHPPLSGIPLTLLAREGLVEFYESCGFVETEPIAHPGGEPESLRFLAYRRNG